MEDADLKHEDPRRSTKVHEEELDTPLLALFRRVEAPAPSSDFVMRTMRVVRQSPLAPGRRPLRGPAMALLSWAALVVGVAASGVALIGNMPVFAAVFTTLVSGGVGVAVWLMQFVGPGLVLSDLCTTIGLAVSRAVVTKEGSVGLAAVVAVGALSLSALYRVLMMNGPERGVSQWQEL